MPQDNNGNQQMLSDFSALPAAEQQKVLATLPEGHILKDFAALPSSEQQKVLGGFSSPANAGTEQHPLVTPLPGESFADTMARAERLGRQTTPEQIAASTAEAKRKAPLVLAAAPLAGPTLLTAGAIAPEAASAAVGGGIPGAVAGGATGAVGLKLLEQAATGKNPISSAGATDLGETAITGAAAGALFGAGSKLLNAAANRIGSRFPAWDAITGYAKALEEAKNANLSRYRLAEQNAGEAITEAQQKFLGIASQQPTGQAGNWAKLNESIGTPAKAIRIGRGVSDVDKAFGIPGRALEAEGFTPETLAQMKPPEQAQLIGPRWQAAGKAVQGTADKATEEGVLLDAGKSAHEVLKRIPDTSLQEKAIEIFNEHTRALDIANVREMTPSQALQLRQALRSDARFGPTGDFSSIKGIGAQLYRAVSGDLHEAVPAMSDVDMHYGDLTEAVSAIQKNVGKYLVGKWTPPVSAIEKAKAAIPELPNVSPYTPLPSRYTYNLNALKKFGPVGGAAAGGYGIYRTIGSLLDSSSRP